MSPTAEEIKTLFNQIAPVYDSLNDGLSFGLHRIWKLMAVKWSNPHPQATALDLCCGSGDMSFLLAKQIEQGKVIGVDFSAELLEVARQRQLNQTQLKSKSIEWIEADVLDLPFADNHFDCATMGYGLRNVTDIPLCLTQIRRVLKPNAKVAILDFNKPTNEIVANSQKWYLDNIVVNLANTFQVENQYAYIYESLERFPDSNQQIQLALDASYTQAIHYPLLGGMMGVLLLTK